MRKGLTGVSRGSEELLGRHVLQGTYSKESLAVSARSHDFREARSTLTLKRAKVLVCNSCLAKVGQLRTRRRAQFLGIHLADAPRADLNLWERTRAGKDHVLQLDISVSDVDVVMQVSKALQHLVQNPLDCDGDIRHVSRPQRVWPSGGHSSDPVFRALGKRTYLLVHPGVHV